MSKFKVGDRVRNKVGNWLGTVTAIGQGSPHAMGGTGTMRVHEDNTPAPIGYYAEYFDLISSSPSIGDLVHPSGAKVEAGPGFALETATGSELDRLAAEIGAGPRLHSECDASFRLSTVQYAAWKQRTADVFRAAIRHGADCSCATQAEWSEALAQLNEKHKALDTVRRFLGGTRMDSLTLSAQREAREVMAVVLLALDSGRANK